MDPKIQGDIKGDFDKMDKNKDGQVDLLEFCYHCYKFSEYKLEEIEVLFKKLDVNGDGKISWEEYLAYMLKRHAEWKEKVLTQIFVRLDKNGDGKITVPELKECGILGFGHVLTDKEIEEFMLKVDTNKDGVISKEEFVNYMESN